jgi:hypothetical protein
MILKATVEIEQKGFGPVKFEFTFKTYEADSSVMSATITYLWEYEDEPKYITGINKGKLVSDDVLDTCWREIDEAVDRSVAEESPNYADCW